MVLLSGDQRQSPCQAGDSFSRLLDPDISHPMCPVSPMAPFGDWTFNPVESRVAGTGSPRPSNGPEGAMVGAATSAHTLSS